MVFDWVLIETLPQAAAYAVKGGTVIFDTTGEDAHLARLDVVAAIINAGSNAVGTVLERRSGTFRQRFAGRPG
jgi:uncharacterized protein with ATP-grasp and redox domains